MIYTLLYQYVQFQTVMMCCWSYRKSLHEFCTYACMIVYMPSGALGVSTAAWQPERPSSDQQTVTLRRRGSLPCTPKRARAGAPRITPCTHYVCAYYARAEDNAVWVVYLAHQMGPTLSSPLRRPPFRTASAWRISFFGWLGLSRPFPSLFCTKCSVYLAEI
jgi:hypothetical protein